MATDQIPYLDCRHCQHTIWLPDSSKLSRPVDHLTSDNQYTEMYVCPDCKYVHEYSPLKVNWTPIHRGDVPKNLRFLFAGYVQFDCQSEACEQIIQIRRIGWEDETITIPAAQLLHEAELWVLDVRCKNGHAIKTVPPMPAVQVVEKLLDFTYPYRRTG
jgi:hypothetical protein